MFQLIWELQLTYFILSDSICLLRKVKPGSKISGGGSFTAPGAGGPAGCKTLDTTWRPKDNGGIERDMETKEKDSENADLRPGQGCCTSKIRFWLSRPLLCGEEHPEQDRVCGTDRPHQLAAATGNSGFRKPQYNNNNKKSLNTGVYLPIKPVTFLHCTLNQTFGALSEWAGRSCGQNPVSSITKCLCWAEPICCRAFCCKAAVTSPSLPAQFCWCQFLCATGSLYVVTHVGVIRKELINDWHNKLCLI